MVDKGEDSPLLFAQEPGAEFYDATTPDNGPSAPPYQADAPPPYWAVPAVGSTSLCCGVCGSQLIVNTNSRRIVKCGVCREATPISRPPAGKRFIRCPCHCLLICNASSQRVGCPRPHCKRVIDLTGPVSGGVAVSHYEIRASCGHCHQTFMSPPSGDKKRVRCPHCRKVSFIGRQYPRKRCVYFFLMALFFAVVAGGLIAATVEEARDYNAIYAIWTFLLLLCVSCVCWALYWARIKISTPLQS